MLLPVVSVGKGGPTSAIQTEVNHKGESKGRWRELRVREPLWD